MHPPPMAAPECLLYVTDVIAVHCESVSRSIDRCPPYAALAFSLTAAATCLKQRPSSRDRHAAVLIWHSFRTPTARQRLTCLSLYSPGTINQEGRLAHIGSAAAGNRDVGTRHGLRGGRGHHALPGQRHREAKAPSVSVSVPM